MPVKYDKFGLDIQNIMLLIIKKENISMPEFWHLPLFIVLEFMGAFVSAEKKPISRKRLIDRERQSNKNRGIL